MRKYKGMMLEDLENALAEHAPAGGELASELPPLTIDGIPVSVDKMTQVTCLDRGVQQRAPSSSGCPSRRGSAVRSVSRSRTSCSGVIFIGGI